ncbi:hypothetical protein SAMN02745664_101197 [Moraxella cuniculi DSM 21768]|uniref:Uncharacterized protein n=2 Tax=Moraxella cuniculi TaxID=34061 RepID=A0A1N7DDU7_9GAMM|nr:hypothetical protein [Moraxella cuniculi]SIR74013.1 hypothetical protein SAMN02745664_101197 [Moraxella cuniculi DSM 21768]
MTTLFKPTLLAVSLVALLSACSKPADKPASSSTTTTTAGITINNASEPETLDPQLAQGV